jgi:3-methyladenine DNA glycosylase Tag
MVFLMMKPIKSSKTKPPRATPDERIPRPVKLSTLDDHLEIITRAVFQAGLSWAMIDSQWGAFEAGFDHFSVERVANYGEFDIDRLMSTDGIVHSAKKIAGTIANAKALIELGRRFGSIDAYLARFSSYDELRADVRERFAFVGDLSTYYWLFRTGNPVPRFEDWIARQPKDHPRMREMVLTGRAEGNSSERSGF